ncbi:MAG: hypothetical protein ACYCW6_17845 [Candidatus Xenobia bacterium]
MNRHAHVVLRTPDGHDVEVDRAMVPLIEVLWRKGFETSGCCQGNADPWEEAYVGFTTFDDALRFFKLARVFYARLPPKEADRVVSISLCVGSFPDQVSIEASKLPSLLKKLSTFVSAFGDAQPAKDRGGSKPTG